jgi:hypothetical protein
MDSTADNSPPLHCTLSQAICNPPADFLNIHFNFDTATSVLATRHVAVFTSHLTYSLHATCTAHLILHSVTTVMLCGVQIVNRHVM